MNNDNEHKQDYQQEPNHNHEQKHQHNHERESINTGDTIYFLSTHEHEGLAVVTISVERNAEAHISFQAFCSSLLNIGKRIDESGAIIGHIKAVATSKNHATSFSLTDINVAPTISGSKDINLNGGSKMEAVVIAACIPTADLLDLVIKEIKNAL